MTKWAASLIRISNHEVETLQKRLSEVVDRREAAEMRVVMMDAEAEAEIKRAEGDASAGWYMIGYRKGVQVRRAEAMLEIDQIRIEETGARDALSVAFENLKKYEHVADAAKAALAKKVGKMEMAALDELGLRRAAMGGR
ncbi:flagellar export protein FliJ [Caulobacter sp. D4A]|uniref:flagellar export protein FliJ n=1 Tax=unclassified Caulobacter TaxID=2648921 RepID=UPI000D738F22|nr:MULTISPECIES: flagellar export protein FliJ [unclassified Caulobacter]PXA91938.1 flagellar export protein FliJ [Caulobacter sp. D4A]PXA92066.1 flagellar export protein FliJ [Caulobacter sp. D5]